MALEEEEDVAGVVRSVEHLLEDGAVGLGDRAALWVRCNEIARADIALRLRLHVPEGNHGELAATHVGPPDESLGDARPNLSVVVAIDTLKLVDLFVEGNVFVQLRTLFVTAVVFRSFTVKIRFWLQKKATFALSEIRVIALILTLAGSLSLFRFGRDEIVAHELLRNRIEFLHIGVLVLCELGMATALCLLLAIDSEGSRDQLNCDERIFFCGIGVRDALVVHSSLKRILLLVTVHLLPNELFNVLSPVHLLSVEEVDHFSVGLLAFAREETAD